MGNTANLSGLGCSVYHDGLSRILIGAGGIDRLIAQGVTGITSNPVIFHDAISSGIEYEAQIERAASAGRSPAGVMWDLIIDDVRQTADAFAGVYAATDRRDGYVSVEVDPALADERDATLDAVRHLWSRIDRPNVLIKIPATEAGIASVEPLTAEGINLNVTVVPAITTFEAVFRAHAAGLAHRVDAGLAPAPTAVASLFLARIDTVVDEAIDGLDDASLQGASREDLKGRAGIAMAKIAYQRFLAMKAEASHQAVLRSGGRSMRLLWASTSPKDASRPKLMYVEGLIGPDTVITLPPDVMNEFEVRGRVADGTLVEGVDEAAAHLGHLATLGIGMDRVTTGVQEIVLPLFADAMQRLEALVAQRCRALSAAR